MRLYRAIYRVRIALPHPRARLIVYVANVECCLVMAQAAARMPSRDRRDFVRRRLRFDYDQCRGETNPERIQYDICSYTHLDCGTYSGVVQILLTIGRDSGAFVISKPYGVDSLIPY